MAAVRGDYFSLPPPVLDFKLDDPLIYLSWFSKRARHHYIYLPIYCAITIHIFSLHVHGNVQSLLKVTKIDLMQVYQVTFVWQFQGGFYLLCMSFPCQIIVLISCNVFIITRRRTYRYASTMKEFFTACITFSILVPYCRC